MAGGKHDAYLYPRLFQIDISKVPSHTHPLPSVSQAQAAATHTRTFFIAIARLLALSHRRMILQHPTPFPLCSVSCTRIFFSFLSLSLFCLPIFFSFLLFHLFLCFSLHPFSSFALAFFSFFFFFFLSFSFSFCFLMYFFSF